MQSIEFKSTLQSILVRASTEFKILFRSEKTGQPRKTSHVMFNLHSNWFLTLKRFKLIGILYSMLFFFLILRITIIPTKQLYPIVNAYSIYSSNVHLELMNKKKTNCSQEVLVNIIQLWYKVVSIEDVNCSLAFE